MGIIIAIACLLVITHVLQSIWNNLKEIKMKPTTSTYLKETDTLTNKIYELATNWHETSLHERMEKGKSLQTYIAEQTVRWEQKSKGRPVKNKKEVVLSGKKLERELLCLFWEAVYDLYCTRDITDMNMGKKFNDEYLPLVKLFKPQPYDFLVKTLTEKPS